MISPANGPFPSGSTDVQEEALEVVVGRALLDEVDDTARDVHWEVCDVADEGLADEGIADEGPADEGLAEERTAPF